MAQWISHYFLTKNATPNPKKPPGFDPPDGHPVGGMAETGIIIADNMSIPMSACRMIAPGKIERAIVACENDLSRISGH